MKMRFGKLFLAFGVLLLLCAGALFLFRTSLISYGVTLILEQQGARQVNVALERVHSGAINFKQLDFILPRGSRVLDVELQNLRVSFAPAELLHGQVEEITLEQMTLRQSAAPGREPTESAAPIDVPELLQQLNVDWHNRLPFRSATIATLKLAAPDLLPALTQPLTLSVSRTDSGVTVVCRPLSGAGSAEVHLLLETDGETISLNAAAAEGGELNATLNETRLKGSFSLELARLNSLLVLGGSSAVQAFDQIGSAGLSGSFSVKMDHWPPYNMQAHLTAESVSMPATALKGISVDFDMEGDAAAGMRQTLQTGRLQIDIGQLSGADFALSGMEGQLELSAEARGNFRLGGASAFRVAAFKNANTSFQKGYIPLNGTLRFTHENQVQLQLSGEERWRVAELKSTDLSIAEVTLHPAFTLQLTTVGGHISYTPDLHVNLKQLSTDEVQIPSLDLHPGATAQLNFARDEVLKWTLKNSPWRIQIPLVENPQMEIRPGELDLSLTQLAGNGSTVSMNGNAQTDRIAITANGRKARLRDIVLKVSLTPKEIKGEGDFRIDPFKQPLGFSFQHRRTPGEGTFRLTTPSPLVMSEQLELSRALEPWHFPFNVVTGRIDLTLSAAWAPGSESTARGEISLEDIGGQWGEITFNGLSLNHRIRLWPTIESLDQAVLVIDLITSGVPLTQIRAILQLHQSGETLDAPLTIALKEGRFSLFDSVFSLKPFTYRENAPKNLIEIDTAKFDLAQLTPLFKSKGLQMSGLVAAALPIEIGEEGVEMVDGTIRQKGPGVIIYNPEDQEMLRRAGMPKIVIEALKNFHYNNLEADMAYQPDGQLDLAVRIRGKSPSAGTERPIHLNLNIEQNLLSLLESLRYSDIFDRKIEEYIKKKR